MDEPAQDVTTGRPRGVPWTLAVIGVINLVVGGLLLTLMTSTLHSLHLPTDPRVDLGQGPGGGGLAGGADSARRTVLTWTRFATDHPETTPGTTIARWWLATDTILWPVLGYGLLAVAVLLLLADRPTMSGRIRRLLQVVAVAGLVLAVIDVLENGTAWKVLAAEGGGPTSLLRILNAVKWILAAPVLVLAVLLAGLGAVHMIRRYRPRIARATPPNPLDLRRWAGRFAGRTVVLLVSIFVLAAVAGWGTRSWPVVLAIAFFGVAAYRFNAALEDRRPWGDGSDERTARRVRLAIGVELFVLGALAAMTWQLTETVNGLGFAGVTAALFGASSLLGEFRWSRRPWRRVAALVLVGLTAVLAVVALWLLSPLWGVVVLAFALFVPGVVGGSAVTEDVLRRLSARRAGRTLPPFVLPVAGAVLVVGAIAIALLVADYALRNLVLLLVVLALFAVVIGSNWSAEAFIAVSAVALGWALTAGSTPLPPELQPGQGSDAMVVLGDSYTSGEGAENYFEGTNDSSVENKCRRAPTAYGPLLLDLLEPAPDGLVFVACSGAKARHITNDAQYKGEPPGSEAGLDQLANVEQRRAQDGFDISTVLIGLGGNDAGFGEVVQTCIMPGDCSELAHTWLNKLNGVGERLELTYREIRAQFGESVTYVAVLYPVPIGPAGCPQSNFTADEHRSLHAFTTSLNDIVAAAATREGFHVLTDTADALADNGICLGDGVLGVNYLTPGQEIGALENAANPQNWFHNSMHPNERGHRLLAEAAARWFERERPGPIAPSPESPAPPTVTVDDLSDVTCDDATGGLDYCEYEGWTWVAAQSLASIRRHLVLVLVAFTGIWLIVVRILLLWRRQDDERPDQVSQLRVPLSNEQSPLNAM